MGAETARTVTGSISGGLYVCWLLFLFQFQGQAKRQASLRTADLIDPNHKAALCSVFRALKSLDAGITIGMFVPNTCLHFEIFPDDHM